VNKVSDWCQTLAKKRQTPPKKRQTQNVRHTRPPIVLTCVRRTSDHYRPGCGVGFEKGCDRAAWEGARFQDGHSSICHHVSGKSWPALIPFLTRNNS
jgi:hypothetical protein